MKTKSSGLTGLLGKIVSRTSSKNLIGELALLKVNYPNINKLREKVELHMAARDGSSIRCLERMFQPELEAIREFNSKQHLSSYESKRNLLELLDESIASKLEGTPCTVSSREILVRTEAL